MSSYLQAARDRRASEVRFIATSCGHTGRSYVARYGDSTYCSDCHEQLTEDTPGRAKLDLDFANGDIEWEEYYFLCPRPLDGFLHTWKTDRLAEYLVEKATASIAMHSGAGLRTPLPNWGL